MAGPSRRLSGRRSAGASFILDAERRLDVTAVTDAGCACERNEDHFEVFDGRDRRRGALLVVADGMGPGDSGRTAAHLAVRAIGDVFLNGGSFRDATTCIEAAFSAANRRLREYGRSHAGLGGMSAAVTAALVRDGSVLCAHVGDTAAHLLTAGGIERLTREHPLGLELRRLGMGGGVVGADCMLTQSLGFSREVRPDVTPEWLRLSRGDRILLSSNGLTDLLTDDEILVLSRARAAEVLGRDLVALARRRGAPDNVTALVAAIDRVG